MLGTLRYKGGTTNLIIPRIPLDIFLKIWVPSNIFGFATFGIKLIPQIEKYKEKLKNSIGIDKETGIPKLPDKEARKLLEFDDKKHLIYLGIAILFAFILGIIYVIFSSIEPLSSHEWYQIFVSICGWITILLVLIVIISAMRLWIYAIQLRRKVARIQ